MTASASPSLTASQAALLHQLQQQERLYATAVDLIARLQRSGSTGQQSDLAKLQSQLTAIRDCGQDVQRATSAWVAEGQPRNPELQAALGRQEQNMLEFLQKVDSLQSEFRTMKERLQPQLDQEVTRRSMHQAYQRSMRTGRGQ